MWAETKGVATEASHVIYVQGQHWGSSTAAAACRAAEEPRCDGRAGTAGRSGSAYVHAKEDTPSCTSFSESPKRANPWFQAMH